MSTYLQGMPEVPLRMERQPDLGVPTRQGFEQQRRVGTDATAPPHDDVGGAETGRRAYGNCDLEIEEQFTFARCAGYAGG